MSEKVHELIIPESVTADRGVLKILVTAWGKVMKDAKDTIELFSETIGKSCMLETSINAFIDYYQAYEEVVKRNFEARGPDDAFEAMQASIGGSIRTLMTPRKENPQPQAVQQSPVVRRLTEHTFTTAQTSLTGQSLPTAQESPPAATPPTPQTLPTAPASPTGGENVLSEPKLDSIVKSATSVDTRFPDEGPSEPAPSIADKGKAIAEEVDAVVEALPTGGEEIVLPALKEPEDLSSVGLPKVVKTDVTPDMLSDALDTAKGA